MGKSTFVIVPAFNEGEIIISTLQGLIAAGYSVVVVDDGSTNGMDALVANLPVYFLRHPVNLGQGAALQTGMTFALQNGAEIIVHFDADGQHKVEDIETLLKPLHQGEADVVLGSRFLREQDRSAVPLKKRVLLRLAVVVNWLTTGVRLTDAHNGLRAFTAKAARKESTFTRTVLLTLRKSLARCLVHGSDLSSDQPRLPIPNIRRSKDSQFRTRLT